MPSQRFGRLPYATMFLLTAHAAAFAMLWSWAEFRDALSLQPDAVLRRGQLWRLETGLFVAAPPRMDIHLLLAASLWTFGRELERRIGAANLLAAYLIGGAFASLLWCAAASVWEWRQAMSFPGAVSVLVVLRLLRGPRTPLPLLGAVAVPAWIIVLAYFVGAAWFLKTRVVDASAQLVGGLFALLYDQFDWRLTTLSTRVRRWTGSRTPSPTRPVVAAGRTDPAFPAEAAPANDGEFNARVDQLLAKISEAGYQSLTEEEIQLLLQASQRYRDRPR